MGAYWSLASAFRLFATAKTVRGIGASVSSEASTNRHGSQAWRVRLRGRSMAAISTTTTRAHTFADPNDRLPGTRNPSLEKWRFQQNQELTESLDKTRTTLCKWGSISDLVIQRIPILGDYPCRTAVSLRMSTSNKTFGYKCRINLKRAE